MLFVDIERLNLVFNTTEVDAFQVETANSTVIHGAIVEHSMCNVGRRGPLCGTGYIGRCLSGQEFGPDGNIEIVEDMETLGHSPYGVVLLGGGGLIEGRTNESGRGRDVAGKSDESAAGTERGERDVAERFRIGRARIEIDVVVEIGDLPLKSR